MLKVAQLVEFWLVTPEVAGSYPVLQPISHPKCRGFIQTKGYIMVTVAQINELRKATQVSMLLCKQAL